MLDPKIFEDLANKLSSLLPSELKTARDEVQNQFNTLLQSTFNKLDLVTQDDLALQTQIVLKTREKIEALEARIAELEQKLSEK